MKVHSNAYDHAIHTEIIITRTNIELDISLFAHFKHKA